MYDFRALEKKWQDYYAREKPFNIDLDKAERPFYNLMMFPYPSAAGLHIGNMFSFIGSDVYGRFMKLKGYDVFEPIGFDAFGIHSENYALKVGKHPAELTPKSIEYFREEQLKKLGNIYDWDSEAITSSPEYYKWTQWIFIQLYKRGLAEKRDSSVNWCPSCKTVLADEQVIDGHCERCSSEVDKREMSQWFFKITEYAEKLLSNLDWLDWTDTTKNLQRAWIGKSAGASITFDISGMDEKIEVFTTRPDTIYGVTYIVVAPEYPLVDKLITPVTEEAFEEFRNNVKNMDMATRTSISRPKNGIFTGSYAIHPLTGEELPIWIGDYVLAEYGTGAVMAVPAHDERDFAFARKYGLEIRQVIECDPSELPYTEKGIMVNSDKYTGMKSTDFIDRIDTIDTSIKGSVNYHLHDWCISRQRYWGPPIPMIYCDRCGTVPVPEEDLPVMLPKTDDYIPDGSGKSPLAKSPEFVNTTCPICGGPARRETDVSDNFLDSAWYYLRYLSPKNDEAAFERELVEKWCPVNMYIGGNEHATLHLMYSRFIAMALHDMGYLSFEEPFTSFRGHGLIIKDGEKMSKSKGNIVNPNQYFDSHGVDALRTYLMFMGTFLEGGDFRDSGMDAIKRFLNRVWEVANMGEGKSSLNLKIKMAETIEKVEYSITNIKPNTAIAAIMEFVNEASKENVIERQLVIDMAKLLSPFAPFLCEEIYSIKGGKKRTILEDGFPSGYEKYASMANVELPVQISGKMRGKVTLEQNSSQEKVMEAIMKDEKLASMLEGKTIRKIIYVQDKIINIIV
ncbi:MAG TPA: leucine--tRNA ligase [Mesotoga infera]|jgi:leucyl-tRNA synthetase|nr:leucine--tRNA ligase [Mesotoga sp.]NLI06000.1 leucine--tRNA ligase [Thermotogaceae bacterium]HOI35603.1 leucine--tRNA ligase [Mesotoga infera]HON27103.1 leucine--tRNA ligase [Mesotoga infera]HPD36916.1 leucine--tRNA ligase [Mesotoga infera]